MSSSTNTPSVRYVPENAFKSMKSFKFHLSFDYVQSKWGVYTVIQMLSSFVTFVVSASSRTHKYEVTDLVVYVAPKAAFLFVVMYSFCFFYVDFLIILAATFSTFDTKYTQLSLFYFLGTLSASIFNICASIAIFLTYPETVMNNAIAMLACVSAMLYAIRSSWTLLKLIRLHRNG